MLQKDQKATPRLPELWNFKPKSKKRTSDDDDSALDQKIILCFGYPSPFRFVMKYCFHIVGIHLPGIGAGQRHT